MTLTSFEPEVFERKLSDYISIEWFCLISMLKLRILNFTPGSKSSIFEMDEPPKFGDYCRNSESIVSLLPVSVSYIIIHLNNRFFLEEGRRIRNNSQFISTIIQFT
jgi:hypothetical protein